MLFLSASLIYILLGHNLLSMYKSLTRIRYFELLLRISYLELN